MKIWYPFHVIRFSMVKNGAAIEHYGVTDVVTLKDVAHRTNVSIGTVSRVFNNHNNVNRDIRERVLQAASELGYSGPSRRNSRSPHKTSRFKEIGFFLYLDDPTSSKEAPAPFWANILHGAEVEAHTSQIRLTYQTINPQSKESFSLLNRLNELQLEGMLLVGPADAETIDVIRSSGIPLVLVDNYIRRPSLDAVLSDNFEGTIEAVEYLLSKGHSRIAFIGKFLSPGSYPKRTSYTIEWRAKGYQAALQRAGLPIDDELIIAHDLSPTGGYEACMRLLEKGIPCSAICCANDPTAVGVLRALRDAGIRVPEDISVIGFDDDMAEHLTPALTTLRVNKEAMGVTAVKRLLARVHDPQAVSVTSILGVELIKRDSVAVCRHP